MTNIPYDVPKVSRLVSGRARIWAQSSDFKSIVLGSRRGCRFRVRHTYKYRGS